VLAVALGCATPAAAQFSGSLSISSDDRFRGHSLSQGRPTVALGLSYDHVSGLYFNLLVRGVLARHTEPELLSVEENIGFARQVSPHLSIDVGAINLDYTKYYNGLRTAHYQEYYAGIIAKGISAHVHYSPRYFGWHAATIYGDVDGALALTGRWRLTGHVGLLHQLSGATIGTNGRTNYDYRIGTAVRCGAVDFQLEWTGGGRGHDYYANEVHSRDALVAGATLSF
jgi:uncharacterized protein (TIGR02001 family)